jgi:hypothetical protein
MALLWVEIFEVYLGVKSVSKSVVEVGDGARYRMAFGRFSALEVIEEIKSPCYDKGFAW